MSRRRALALLGGLYALICLIHFSPFGDRLESRIAHPLEFLIRERFGHPPRLDPRIKAFEVDDKTMASLHAETVPLESWIDLLTSLGKARPSAIFIDKVFGLLPTDDEGLLGRFMETARRGPPLVTGASLTSYPIAGRAPLRGEGAVLSDIGHPLDFLPLRRLYRYGAASALGPAFDRVGYLNVLDDGYVEPLLRLDRDLVVPHWALYGAPQIRARGTAIYAGEARLPLDRKGRTLANLGALTEYQDRIASLAPTFERARLGLPPLDVRAGDVVVILTRLSTSDAAMKESPLGLIPDPLINLALLNSAITGQWLKPVGGEPLLLALVCASGGLALILSPSAFLASLLGLLALLIAAGLTLFCKYGILFPWLSLSGAAFLCGGVLFGERFRFQDRRAKEMRFSLEGVVGPDKLRELLQRPQDFHLRPSHQVLTVMFVDIEGFSMAAERCSPQAVFEQLKELMENVTRIIHAHDGIVDKNLGDGLLCFFGYHYGEGTTFIPDHARRAVECALQIQSESLKTNLTRDSFDQPIYPLRIGINTDEVYIGDLGVGGRIELTVVGGGVNFAQRLEAACESYRVLVSASTRDRMGEGPLRDRLSSRWTRIKYHEEPVEAYELNPFADNPPLLEAGLQAHRRFHGISRLDTRWSVEQPQKMTVSTDFGPGEVLNFSRSGLMLRLDRYLGRGITVSFSLESLDHSLGQACLEHGLVYLVGEVRWGRPEGEKYLHGVQITNLSPEQREKLLACLRAANQRALPGNKSTG